MRQNKTGGFTLIEIMVVLAILAALIGAGTVMIRIAQARQQENRTKTTINSLAGAIELLHTSDQLPYPPTFANAISVGGTNVGKQLGPMNDTNVGIESLYIVFRMPGVTAKPQGVDDQVANTDDDKATQIGTMASPELFEYIDAWGNPLVYFNSRDYKDVSKCEKYKKGDGTEVKVHPNRNQQTGEYYRSDSYQLFSMGPDGVPNTADDIEFGR